MDYIFDRFEKLFKSWLSPSEDKFSAARHYGSQDPDFIAASEELEDFLNQGRTQGPERSSFYRKDSTATGQQSSRADSRTDNRTTGASAIPAEVQRAYRCLGLPVNADFAKVKATYKQLLMKNHPDRNSATPQQLKSATEISAILNAAYQAIEQWTAGTYTRE